MSIIDLLDGYIEKCSIILEESNVEEAEKLSGKIENVFGAEIPNITHGLDKNNILLIANPRLPIDHLKDLGLLQSKLINYKCRLIEDQEKRKEKLEFARLNQLSISTNVENHNENNSSANATSNVDITVTLQNTVEKIKQIEEDKLSGAEKEEIIEMLGDVDKYRLSGNKSKLWGAIKSVLGWLATKGVEIATTALPYIIGALNS